MIIQVDTREQTPLEFGDGFEVEIATLPVGDYSIKGFGSWDNPKFIVERKSLDDLVHSLTHDRPRFAREVEKMRQFQFRALLIEGLQGEIEFQQYHSKATPQSILQSLAAIQVRCNLHVIWAGDHDKAARMLERLVRQFARGIEKDARLIRAERTDIRQGQDTGPREIASLGAT